MVGVGPHERSLEPGISSAAAGGCGGHELRVTVGETSTNVGSNVLEAEEGGPRGVNLLCPVIADRGFPPPRVATAGLLYVEGELALPTGIGSASVGRGVA